ncbi:MAG: Ig-like domain-containing protein [Paracoccaceae bacterium]
MARSMPTWASWLAVGAGLAAVVAYVVFVSPPGGETGDGTAEPPAAALSPQTDAPEAAGDTAAAATGATAPSAEAPAPATSETAAASPDSASVPEATAPAAATEAAAAPDTAPEKAPEAVASTAAPTFDTVRVDPEGGALVAGRAEPGARVVVRVDGQVVGEGEADRSGNFVTLFSLPPGDTTRVMTLEAAPASAAEDAAPVLAEQSVIIQPGARTAPSGGEDRRCPCPGTLRAVARRTAAAAGRCRRDRRGPGTRRYGAGDGEPGCRPRGHRGDRNRAGRTGARNRRRTRGNRSRRGPRSRAADGRRHRRCRPGRRQPGHRNRSRRAADRHRGGARSARS